MIQKVVPKFYFSATAFVSLILLLQDIIIIAAQGIVGFTYDSFAEDRRHGISKKSILWEDSSVPDFQPRENFDLHNVKSANQGRWCCEIDYIFVFFWSKSQTIGFMD